MGSLKIFKKDGFTLMEILVTVAIISLLAGLAIPGYFRTVEVGRSNEARTNLSILHMGLKVYRLNNGTYAVTGGLTDVADANTKLNLDMVSQNYDLSSFVPNGATGYTATFTRNTNNGGAGTKQITATYPDPLNATGPPAINDTVGAY